MRKNPDVWRKWHPASAHNLHGYGGFIVQSELSVSVNPVFLAHLSNSCALAATSGEFAEFLLSNRSS